MPLKTGTVASARTPAIKAPWTSPSSSSGSRPLPPLALAPLFTRRKVGCECMFAVLLRGLVFRQFRGACAYAPLLTLMSLAALTGSQDGLQVPDTLVFSRTRPVEWFYTDEGGALRKKAGADITLVISLHEHAHVPTLNDATINSLVPFMMQYFASVSPSTTQHDATPPFFVSLFRTRCCLRCSHLKSRGSKRQLPCQRLNSSSPRTAQHRHDMCSTSPLPPCAVSSKH
jgi:hypothetical protein